MAVVPLDGGWGWVVVAGSFYTMFCMNGTMMCFGILFVEFVEYFQTSRSKASIIGGLVAVTFVISCVTGSMLIKKFGYRVTAIMGSAIASISFFASFFVNRIEMLFITYGITGGYGLGLSYYCGTVVVNEYFHKKRSLAYSIAMTGSALGYGIFPYMYEYLIIIGGWQYCMIALASFWAQNIVVGALYRPLKRTPETYHEKTPILDGKLLKDWKFHLYCVGNILWWSNILPTPQSIPDNCLVIGYSKEQGAVLFSILGWTMVFARLLAGVISVQKWTNRTLYISIALFLQGFTQVAYAYTDNYIALCFLTAMISVGISQIHILLAPIIADIFGPEHLITGYAYSQVYVLASFGASPLIGYLFDITGTYEVSFLTLSAFAFVAGGIFLFLYFHEFVCSKKQIEKLPVEEEELQYEISLLDVLYPSLAKLSSSRLSLANCKSKSVYNSKSALSITTDQMDKMDKVSLVENGTDERGLYL